MKEPQRYDRSSEALVALWVQTLHPSIVVRALDVSGKASVFLPDSYVSEKEWQGGVQTAERLSEAYARYAVLFVAAMADPVENNYKDLLDELEALIGDAAELQELVEFIETQQGMEAVDMEAFVQDVENPTLKEMLAALQITQQAERNKRVAEQMHDHLNQIINEADVQIEALEQQHLTFLSSQLSIYEQSKDMVKKLAAQGLNLAGKFVAAAQTAAQERGKGGKER